MKVFGSCLLAVFLATPSFATNEPEIDEPLVADTKRPALLMQFDRNTPETDFLLLRGTALHGGFAGALAHAESVAGDFCRSINYSDGKVLHLISEPNPGNLVQTRWTVFSFVCFD